MLSKIVMKTCSSSLLLRNRSVTLILPQQLYQQRLWYSRTATTSAAAAAVTSTSSTWLCNSLSFAAPEESEQAYILSMIPNKYHHYLHQASPPLQQHQHQHTINDFSHIPTTSSTIRTLRDVLLSKQACIVTTLDSPHTIVAVNDAWTTTCGYTQDEVHHQSISSILHGPLTNDSIIQSTMERVHKNIINNNNCDNDGTASTNTVAKQQEQVEDMYVVNYKKDSTPFINHVTISKIILSDDQPQIQFLLGMIQPTLQGAVPLRMVV